MQQQKSKQSHFLFQKICIDSRFESGNLENATNPTQNQFNLWIGSDHKASFKTWFYFSVSGVAVGNTLTFSIMNMNNQVKLYKEGLVPVYKTDNNQNWSRIKTPIPPNAVIKTQLGFQITFKHTFTENCKHYFAFTYPWTNQENKILVESLMEKINQQIFSKYQTLCQSYKGRPIKLLTLTRSVKGEQLNFETINLNNQQIYAFPNRKGIFISARVHPGQTASSHIMNGIIKSLFSNDLLASLLLQNCVFYLIPIINPDGVAQGHFRTDSQGKNLNRFYTNPDPEFEPQIYGIKQFLITMIKKKRIQFCLDLHAHVNKQGAFIYGNSTSSLYGQMKVCLFPKLLSFNSEFFDFESCNFSQKNMSSKDKGDQLSKEGASRVAIFKDTGMVECWTLQCNYNSARLTHNLQQPTLESKNGSVSSVVLTGKVEPEDKDQLKYLNIPQFQALGLSIIQTICDYYSLKNTSRAFATKLKNMNNFKINTAIASLRLLPFRFDTECRKLLDCLNSGVNLNANLDKLALMIQEKNQKNGSQLTSAARLIKSQFNIVSNSETKREQSGSSKQQSKQNGKINSLRKIQKIVSKQKPKGSERLINKVVKAEQFVNRMPRVPRAPLKTEKKQQENVDSKKQQRNNLNLKVFNML